MTSSFALSSVDVAQPQAPGLAAEKPTPSEAGGLGRDGSNGQVTPIAVHVCCGPCALEPVAQLKSEGFSPTLFWANPNIQPVAEHDHRLQVLKGWAAQEGIDVVECEQDRAAWERAVAPKGFEREARCRACYSLRLAETCKAAKAAGFAHVTTTLAVSPHQLHEVCDEVLVAVAHAHGLEPVVRDFRPRFQRAQERAQELGLYRQNYCGCRFSKVEATLERLAARAKKQPPPKK